jgi:hypothetical protein
MEAVARHFFGEPNRRLSKRGELRFGSNGSKSIDLQKGVYFDHENNQGGDALDLIMRELSIGERHEAYGWAERQGYWINGHATNGSVCGSREVAAYDYTDEAGALLYQAVRLEPKDFPPAPTGRPRRLDLERQGRASGALPLAGTVGSARQRAHGLDRRGRKRC